jgi:hypothetical protein
MGLGGAESGGSRTSAASSPATGVGGAAASGGVAALGGTAARRAMPFEEAARVRDLPQMGDRRPPPVGSWVRLRPAH